MAKAGRAAATEADDGAAYEPGESFGYMVNYVARLYARAMGREMARNGAQMGYFPVLLALWVEDGRTQSELAARAQIEQPTMAATLTRMERDGFITREPDPRDRRAARIVLTPKAKALRAPLTEAARAINAHSVAALGPEGAATFLKALHMVAAALSRADAIEAAVIASAGRGRASGR